MIHNTFLIRISTQEILARTRYWPVEVPDSAALEFLKTREELRAQDSSLAKMPLMIDSDKFMGRDIESDITIAYVSDPAEDEPSIADRLDTAVKALRSRLRKSGIEKVIETYGTIIEPSIITRLKIALVGEGGVGKTTTLHLLMGETPPTQYVPTIALNLETVENIRFGNYSLVLWDFAGQERFRKLWKFYFHGADVIFLVCDSSLRNVIVSKDILKLIRRDAPKVPVFCMANKQDKPNAMRPEVVQKILGVPTYPMVAIDKGRRDEMLRILMNAAAQYVGVVLPDLPASELIQFTDKATEDAVASYDDEDEEEDAEYEYVLVDEDGVVVEDDGEYEIIEEFDEEEDQAEAAEDKEEIDEPVTPDVEEEDDEDEIETEDIIIEHVVSQDSVSDDVVFNEADSEIEGVPISVIGSEFSEDLKDEESIESGPEISGDLDEREEIEISATTDSPIDAEDIEMPDLSTDADQEKAETDFEEPATTTPEDEAVPIEISEGIGSDPDPFEPGLDITKELISEALDADEIISAELERTSKEELDEAIEAFSSDETVLLEGEKDDTAEIATETLKELDDILGVFESPSVSTDEDGTDDDVDDELDELDAMFSSLSDED